ncbi:MAG TPA: 7TM diverse intracellular signaling domain-containing protein [Cyclobacteriaceae bacterium]|nr:7TM diverse intracellular signaling domain-containing protein [Cyclobacteriaceae bacterium]
MKTHYLIVFFLLISLRLVAQSVLVPTDEVDEIELFPTQLTYLADTTNLLTFDQVSDPSFASKFTIHKSYQNKDFLTNVNYWLRVPVRHSTTTEKVWLIEFYDQTIDLIEAHIPAEGGYRTVVMGDSYPFHDRLFRHKNFEVLMKMHSDEVKYYYFKIRSHEFADIRIAFRSANRFVYYTLNEYFLFGTFYGMIIIISLYNFLIFLAIREIKNIFYIFYILSVAAYAMSLDGVGFQYLWPSHPEWNNYATGLSLYSLIVWALVFTRRFLNTSSNAPALDKALKLMIIARTLQFVIELVFFPNYLIYRNHDIIPLSLIFYTSILVWRNGYKPARFFVIAYGLLFSGFFLRTLVYFNVLQFTTLSHYSLHFSFVFEMLFLTMALGDRVRILKDNRDRAMRNVISQHETNMQLKDKVNRELEAKVKERTVELDHKNSELETSNQRLTKQAREISKINSILDLDNWKLKNRIKEVLEERLHEKAMDYEEFKTLYPDTLSCYRFIETQKWQAGFNCRKCGNEKFFNGSQKFSRRCTRCGYNESVTAFTIFHSLKFPIEKAFYIAYLTVTGKKENTLEDLAGRLDIALNTVWAFRSKVQSRIDELGEHGAHPTTGKWEDVIMTEIPANRTRLKSAPDKSGSKESRILKAKSQSIPPLPES